VAVTTTRRVACVFVAFRDREGSESPQRTWTNTTTTRNPATMMRGRARGGGSRSYAKEVDSGQSTARIPGTIVYSHCSTQGMRNSMEDQVWMCSACSACVQCLYLVEPQAHVPTVATRVFTVATRVSHSLASLLSLSCVCVYMCVCVVCVCAMPLAVPSGWEWRPARRHAGHDQRGLKPVESVLLIDERFGSISSWIDRFLPSFLSPFVLCQCAQYPSALSQQPLFCPSLSHSSPPLPHVYAPASAGMLQGGCTRTSRLWVLWCV
jgi:hypothetical protein